MKMDPKTPVSSLELWAAAKYIGRECATENKEYLICKQANGPNPITCAAIGNSVTNCADDVVHKLRTNYPKQFQSFVKCLNYNDYSYEKCREEEKALRDCWNNDNDKNQ